MLLRNGNEPGLSGKYKWLRGIYHANDDSIIGIPANASSVLRIDAKTDEIELYGEVFIYSHTYIHAYIHAYIHTQKRTYMHAYIDLYNDNYFRTCKRT